MMKAVPVLVKVSRSFLLLGLSFGVFATSTVSAKNVQYRKTQEVNFDSMDVDGQARSPDGSFLAQKRGIDFMPLYKVRKNFDDNIKESSEYMK